MKDLKDTINEDKNSVTIRLNSQDAYDFAYILKYGMSAMLLDKTLNASLKQPIVDDVFNQLKKQGVKLD